MSMDRVALVRYGAMLPLSTGGWLGPRVSTDAVEKGIEPQVLGPHSVT
jgi:hypothetical protein